MHHLGWGGLFTFITCLFISVFVFLKGPKRLLNKSWAIFALSVAIFGFGFFKVDTSTTKEAAFFWWQFMYVGVIFIAVLFLHFNLVLVDIKNRKILYFLYPINFIFLIFNLFSRLFFKSVTWKFSNVWYANAGILFIYFFLFWWGTVGCSAYLIYKNYKKSTGIRRNQLKYWFLAIVVGYFGGIFCYLPIFNINIIYPYPIYLVGLWPLILTYAIIRYRTFEIDTVIHRTILWLLTSLWLVLPAYLIFKLIRPQLQNLSDVWLTLATLVLFYIFLWYYRYFQPRIDHFFRRRKYDYQTILGKVAEKISTTIDIEDLTCQLLTEVCETMYLRNGLLYILDKENKRCFLIGRRGYQEVDGVKQRTALEIYPEEERVKQPQLHGLKYDSSLISWVAEHQDILEREQVELDPKYQPIREEALRWSKEYEVEVLVPLTLEGKVNAVLGLGKKENLQAYTLKDLQLLKKLGQEAGVTLYNALHYEDLAEKERLEEEMKMGRQIQMTLLPRFIPQISGLTVQGLMQPAKEIGGDYYDFITLPQRNQLAVIIGDVSGKGVAAGLLMAMAKTAIHTLSKEEGSPRQILLKTNEILHQHIGGQKFMTLLYLLWQVQNKTLTYSSAGHEHILINRNQTQALEVIQSGGFMLGMLPDIEAFLEEKQIRLEPQDKILLYTDGVTEAQNQAGERFGLVRLKEVFQRHSQKLAQELIQAIKDEVYSFIGTHPQYDDITLVVMEAI